MQVEVALDRSAKKLRGVRGMEEPLGQHRMAGLMEKSLLQHNCKAVCIDTACYKNLLDLSVLMLALHWGYGNHGLSFFQTVSRLFQVHPCTRQSQFSPWQSCSNSLLV